MARVLVNPSSGRGKAARALKVLDRAAAVEGLSVSVSRDLDDLLAQARDAVSSGIDRLVVAGGDGTFHHVAGVLAGTDCALGLIPVGRGNDFPAVLSIPSDPVEALRFALRSQTTTIDLGMAGARCFTGYCGIGFDSEAALVADRAGKLFQGSIAYVYAVLRTLISFRPPLVDVQYDGGRYAGEAMFVIACNISRFGGGMQIAPAARYDDGWLDLVIAGRLRRAELLRVFPKVYRGDHVGHPKLLIVRTKSARIELNRSMVMACDGEPLQHTELQPIDISVRPRALRVIAGAVTQPRSG